MSLISERKQHTFICGMTQSGKTYFASRALLGVKAGVLFFNLQNVDMPRRFLKVSADAIDYEQLIDSLRSGAKIDMRFPAAWRDADIMHVIAFLSRQLLKAGFSESDPVYIAYDECHVYSNYAVKAIRGIATRGLSLGCWAVFITQRPALADLTFYTQSDEHYIFRLGHGERSYFKEKGIDYDKCAELWQENGEHSYVFTNGFTMEGRKAI